MKPRELEGVVLDYVVMKQEYPENSIAFFLEMRKTYNTFMYSTEYNAGVELLEREGISTKLTPNTYGEEKWMAMDNSGMSAEYGPTLLVAAMRCFVTSKLASIKIPERLLCQIRSQ